MIIGLPPKKLVPCPLKRDHFKGHFIFQPSIFRGYVSFQGGTPPKIHMDTQNSHIILKTIILGIYVRFRRGNSLVVWCHFSTTVWIP